MNNKERLLTLYSWNGVYWEIVPKLKNITWSKWQSIRPIILKNWSTYRLTTETIIEEKLPNENTSGSL
jgi:hypothetical protein